MMQLVVHMDLADPACAALFDQLPKWLAGRSYWAQYRAAGASRVEDLAPLHRAAWFEALRLAGGAVPMLSRWNAEQALRQLDVGLDAEAKAYAAAADDSAHPLWVALQRQLSASKEALTTTARQPVALWTPGAASGVWLPHSLHWCPVSGGATELLQHLS